MELKILEQEKKELKTVDANKGLKYEKVLLKLENASENPEASTH